MFCFICLFSPSNLPLHAVLDCKPAFYSLQCSNHFILYKHHKLKELSASELQHSIHKTKIIHCLETITNFNVHLQSKQRAERGQTSGSEGMYYKIHTVLNYKLKSDVLSKKGNKDIYWWHDIQIILKTGLHEDQSMSTLKLYHTDCKQFTEFKLVLHIQELQNQRKHTEIQNAHTKKRCIYINLHAIIRGWPKSVIATIEHETNKKRQEKTHRGKRIIKKNPKQLKRKISSLLFQM